MKVNYVFLKPISINAYHRPDCDIPVITGLYHVELEGQDECLCYEVTYEDGFVDYVPLSEIEEGIYKFVVQ